MLTTVAVLIGLPIAFSVLLVIVAARSARCRYASVRRNDRPDGAVGRWRGGFGDAVADGCDALDGDDD